MIIWGSKMRYKTLGEGEFHCPRCAASRRYLHKSARRFFTLYFIPLIPMKDMGELIECQTCGSAFETAVLHRKAAPASRSADELATMMNTLKPRLEEGYPVEFMVRDLTAARLDRDLAIKAVDDAIGSRRKKCPNCRLTYAATITGCRECGTQLV